MSARMAPMSRVLAFHANVIAQMCGRAPDGENELRT
jgi:hypothetical protein